MLLDFFNPYFWIISFRNFLYDRKLLPIKRPRVPVISVGNISLGGTGKTSLVRFLTEKLSKRLHVGILLRGYKRKSKGYFTVLERGNLRATLDVAGDEAFMLSYLFQGNERVSLSVCEKRAPGAERMERELGIELLLLDDAFQHRAIARDLDLVLIKKEDLSDRIFPFGLLREPLSSLKRADALILSYQEISPFDFTFENKPVFKMYRKNFRIFNYKREPLSQEKLPEFIAFSGLGSNWQFQRVLEKLSIPVKRIISFPDHYHYRDFALDPSEKYLTTLKDFVKFPPSPNLYYLDFEIEVPGLVEFVEGALKLLP